MLGKNKKQKEINLFKQSSSPTYCNSEGLILIIFGFCTKRETLLVLCVNMFKIGLIFDKIYSL